MELFSFTHVICPKGCGRKEFSPRRKKVKSFPARQAIDVTRRLSNRSDPTMNPTRKMFLKLLKSFLLMLFAGLVISVAYAGMGMPAPEVVGQGWLNSGPLRLAELKGKVVLVEFWTFGCYNCRNVEPYVKGWHQKYAGKGLVIIGVHVPEFSYERSVANVQNYVNEHGIKYPVLIDNEFNTWKRYNNRYWPAIYLVDKRGIIRYLRVGEGGYQQTEKQILAQLEESYGS
jgi:thiol-disulfide isomerase/thioredoxin